MPHIRVDGHGIRAITLECFLRILAGGSPDIAAFGIEDQGNPGIGFAQISADRFELVFCALRGKIRNLRLEGTGQIGGGVDDGAAEIENRIGLHLQVFRQLADIRIKTDTQQGIIVFPCGMQFIDKFHG